MFNLNLVMILGTSKQYNTPTYPEIEASLSESWSKTIAKGSTSSITG